MDARQQAALDALQRDVPVAWLVIYPDGTSSIMRDNSRSNTHAAGAHAIRIPLGPLLPEQPEQP